MNAPANGQSNFEKRGPRGYPLGALFLLMAAVAALMAQLTLLAGADKPPPGLMLATTITTIAGAIFGSIVGLHDYRRVLGANVGGIVGLCVGILAGPISAAAESQPLPAITTAGCSAIGLVLFGWLYRISNTRA